jgi:hypothetical protein
MRTNSLLAKLARAMAFAALFASAAVADQKARAEVSQTPPQINPANLPVALNIVDVDCNPCVGGSSSTLIVKWKTSINPRAAGTVKLLGYSVSGKIISCGGQSDCPGKSAAVSAPANATSANITLGCSRVDSCNYSVTLTLKYTHSGVVKKISTTKTGQLPLIG